MATIEDVAQSALAGVNSSAGLVLAGTWANERYAEFATRAHLRHLRRYAEANIPAAVADGTVTTIQGSETVTGNATAKTAWDALDSWNGTFFKSGTVWYEIASYNAQQSTLTLKTPWAESAVSAGSYQVVTRYVRTPRDARQLSKTFVHARLRWPLEIWPQERMVREFPERIYTTFGPRVVSEISVEADGARLLEFYPYSTQNEVVSYLYWAAPKTFGMREDIPGVVDQHMLKVGVMVDAYEHMAAGAAKAGSLEMAGFYANMSGRKRTEWNKLIEYGIVQDQGVDDLAFVVERLGLRGNFEIRNARDEIFARGARP